MYSPKQRTPDYQKNTEVIQSGAPAEGIVK